MNSRYALLAVLCYRVLFYNYVRPSTEVI